MAGTVLIADGVVTNRIALKARLAAAFYRVAQAAGAAEAEARIAEAPLEAVLLGESLAEGDALRLCARLRARPDSADLPVLLLAAAPGRETRVAALRAGADDVLTMPAEGAGLLARLRSLIRSRHAAQELALRDRAEGLAGLAEEASAFAAPARVALACHRPGEAAGWAEALHGSGLAATVLSPRALLSAPGSGWDAVVIGLSPDLPENGLPLFSELRSRRTLRHARLIAVVPGPDAADPGAPGPLPAELAARALDLSADAVLSAPVDPEELQLRLAAQIRRKRVADRLRDQWREGMQAAITDPLTGLYNRRYALPYLARALDMSRRAGRDCAVMLADLDHFKRVNDRWGHAAGDAVLQAVTHRLRDNLRAGDMVARLGGEEFLVVMPDTPRHEARNAARRICRLVRDPPVSLPGGAGAATVTVSIGLAGRFCAPDAQAETGGPPVEGEALVEAQCLLAEADRALYRAKARGRDRVRECPDAA